MILALLTFLLACGGPVAEGEAALAADDIAGAERAFRAALAENPDDPAALYGLGFTFQRAGERGPARDAFEQLIQVAPTSPDGHRGLGSVFLATQDLPAARRSLEKALELAPADPRVLQSLALLELASGEHEAGLARIDEALTLSPEESELLQVRSALLVKLRRDDEAVAAAALAVQHAEGERALAGARLAWVDAVLRSVDGRVAKERCEGDEAVRARLKAADQVLDAVEASGTLRDATRDARRSVRRRRGFVEDACGAGQ